MNLPSLIEKEPQIPPIIAVDFDGTLVEDRFPDIGEQKLSTWYAIENWRKEIIAL